MNKALAEPPKYFRAPVSRGGQPRVDRTGGYRNAGLIRGVSVITKGEALGHGLWIDDTTLEQVADAINATALGVKSRFTHPSMSGDGLGKQVGRIIGPAEVDGDQVFADQHFIQSAHKSPDGNLASYLMDLADDDPTAYGLSIAFSHDSAAMDQFTTDHTVDGEFKSPDPLNTNNYPHVRIGQLQAADAVDEPAANPNGLFHREKDIVSEADAIASFALGLSNDRPNTVQLGLDPDRVRGFVSRFLTTHNLVLWSTGMNDETVETTEATPADSTESTVDALPSNESVEQPKPAETHASAQSEAARYLSAFGKDGPVWLAEGLDFEQARDRQVSELQKQVESLKQKLSAHTASGEQEPVSFNASDKTSRGGFASKIKIK